MVVVVAECMGVLTVAGRCRASLGSVRGCFGARETSGGTACLYRPGHEKSSVVSQSRTAGRALYAGSMQGPPLPLRFSGLLAARAVSREPSTPGRSAHVSAECPALVGKQRAGTRETRWRPRRRCTEHVFDAPRPSQQHRSHYAYLTPSTYYNSANGNPKSPLRVHASHSTMQ